MLSAAMTESPLDRSRVQLHLVLPYKFDPIAHHQVRALLERGYRVEELQRITDREAFVTLCRAGSDPA